MTGKGKHLATEAKKLDPISFIPSQHFDNIPSIFQPQSLHICKPTCNIGGFARVWTVFGLMRRLRRVPEGVPVLKHSGDATGAGTEDGWIRSTQIGTQTGLQPWISDVENPTLDFEIYIAKPAFPG